MLRYDPFTVLTELKRTSTVSSSPHAGQLIPTIPTTIGAVEPS
jgi:hypothetical protein